MKCNEEMLFQNQIHVIFDFIKEYGKNGNSRQWNAMQWRDVTSQGSEEKILIMKKALNDRMILGLTWI
jgi:hypothetical protein